MVGEQFPVQTYKPSWTFFVLLFILYIVSHYMIYKGYENELKKLEATPKDKELQKRVKYWKIVSQWYPAIYVVVLLLLL